MSTTKNLELNDVVFYSFLTTITTGLGALPFLFMKADGNVFYLFLYILIQILIS